MWFKMQWFWCDLVDKIRTLWPRKPNNKVCSVHDFDYDHCDSDDEQFKSLFKQPKAKATSKAKTKKTSFIDPNDIPFGDMAPYTRPKTKKTKKTKK